ncbi:hypothetical protein JCM10207_005114 [Rhodosporidiobolus poonsookiae]
MATFRLLTSPSSSSSSSSPNHRSAFPRLSRHFLVTVVASLALCYALNSAYQHQQPRYPPGSLSPDARGGGAGSCKMSFMSPSYLHLSGFGREFTRLGNGPWGLYLYREAGWDPDPLASSTSPDGARHDGRLSLTGTPVLFVPGNAGSFRQVRSLAAAAARTHWEVPGVPRKAIAGRPGATSLDFFTLDFNDDFSAFHGQTLLDQAEYTADCIRYILSLYAHHEDDPPRVRDHRPDPTSVIVVAHSMGGIVARTAFLHPHFQSGSISTLVTFATPHVVPPVTVDAGVDRVYAAVNSYWREAYGLAPPSSSSALTSSISFPSSSHQVAFRRPSPSELAQLVTISLSGGLSDLTIASESVSLASLIPPSGSHGFTAFTTAIPGVHTPIDHLAILWCRQLMYTIAEGLLAIVDTRRADGVIPREERVRELSRRWLDGLDRPRGGDEQKREAGEARVRRVSLDTLCKGQAVEHLAVGERVVVRPVRGGRAGEAARRVIAVPVPPSRTYAGRRVFELLTSAKVGRKRGENIEVWACDKVEGAQDGDEDDEFGKRAAGREGERDADEPHCTPLFPHLVTRLPGSPHSSVSPLLPAPIDDEQSGTGGLSFLELEAEDEALRGARAVVVVVKGEEEWVVAEWADREKRARVVEKGPLQLLLSPAKIALPSFASSSGTNSLTSPAALVSEVWVPALDTSLLTLRAKVWRGTCHDSTSLFAPLLRQSSALPGFHDSKTFPNVRHASLYTHSSGPYLPPSSAAPASPSAGGAKLQLFLDPTCADEIVLELGVDWWATLGSLVVRYRMAMVSVPFAVVMAVVARQVWEFNSGHPFPAFGPTLSALSRRYLPFLLLSLLALSYAQSLHLTSHASTHAPHAHAHLYAADALPPRWVAEALLGNEGATWAVMAPLVVAAMVGVVAVEYAVVSVLVAIGAWGVSKASKRGCMSLAEPRETLPFQRILTISLLLLVVLFFAPYQFAYLVLVLVHLSSTTRFLALAWDGTPSSASPSSGPSTSATPPSTALTQAAQRRLWDRYHLNLSLLLILVALLPVNALILVVWVRNLAVGWLAPFSSDHNVLMLAGYLAIVEAVQGGRMLQRAGTGKTSSPLSRSGITTLLLLLPAAYAVLYGIRSAHRLYPLTNLALGWLALCTSGAFVGAAGPGPSSSGATGQGVGGAAGKRRTSEPPERPKDDLAAAAAAAQDGVVRKVASIGGGGGREA